MTDTLNAEPAQRRGQQPGRPDARRAEGRHERSGEGAGTAADRPTAPS